MERVYPHSEQQEQEGCAGNDLLTHIATEFAKAEIISGRYEGPARPIHRAQEFMYALKG